MTDAPTPPGSGAPRSEPYDDSFALGPVPGGDVLYQPPQHLGEQGPGRPTAPPWRVLPPPPGTGADAAPPSGEHWPYGRPGEQETEYGPPRPAQPRPAEWGPSRVNIPSSVGPPPPPPINTPPSPSGGSSRWKPSRGHGKKLPTWVLVLGGLWLGLHVLGFARDTFDSVFGEDEVANPPASSAASPAIVQQRSGMDLFALNVPEPTPRRSAGSASTTRSWPS